VVGIRDHQGAFAELIVLPLANLHLIPEALSHDVATFAEPLAAALKVQSQVAVEPGDRVLVVGDGKLGQLVAQTLALTGCQLTVLGHHQRKLAILERWGISVCCDQLTSTDRFDLAIECTGNPSGFSLALEALRPRGVLVLKSTYADQLSCDVAMVVVNEIAVIGSRCGAIAPALQLLAKGRIDVEALIDGRFPLSQGLEAFAAAQAPGALKVLIEVAETT
jgi:threonine dehydrogenase-like Zn-dependent dehydrogenase